MKFVTNNKDNNNLAFYTYAVKKSYDKIPNEKIINEKIDNKTNDNIKKKKIIF